jgi:hypothetical protein
MRAIIATSVRHLRFGLLSPFVIRASSFPIAKAEYPELGSITITGKEHEVE